MTDKRVYIGVLIAIIAQIVIISFLAYGHVVDNVLGANDESTSGLHFFLVSLLLVLPPFVASYYVSHYKYLPSLFKKNQLVVTILVGLLLFALSFLLYINATVAIGISGA